MAEDILASFPEDQVAAWYRRLAEQMAKEKVGGVEPLSATLLRQWLDNRNASLKYQLNPPQHLKTSPHVLDALKYQRDVFLSKQKARMTGKPGKWAGVIPRLQGAPGFEKWDGVRPLDMKYQCLVEIGSGTLDIIRIQRSGTPEEKDLFASLRGFQLASAVRVSGAKIAANVRVSFTSWTCQVFDRYDWDYSEHLTVPNPDYRSKDAGAIRPDLEQIRVEHRNAERLEKKNLAAPYDIESLPWTLNDPAILKTEDVDPAGKLP